MSGLYDSVFDTLSALVARNDDDAVDRLNHRVTVIFLLSLAVLVNTNELTGSPISCWVPAHFAGSHQDYTNQFCWINNTYNLPVEDEIPQKFEQKKEIRYYQWVSVILLIQALGFVFPIYFWRSLNSQSALNFNDVIETAEVLMAPNIKKTASGSGGVDQARNRKLKLLSKSLHDTLNHSHVKREKQSVAQRLQNLRSSLIFWKGKSLGNYVCVLYLLLKFLFLANIALQFLILYHFTGMDFTLYAEEFSKRWYEGENGPLSSKFPRMTMCDVEVRRLGNIHRYTVQCVLPLNLFNEKIFLLIWSWLIFLGLCNSLNTFVWFTRIMWVSKNHIFVHKKLRRLNPNLNKTAVQKFVSNYLTQDGVLLFRLIEYNTNKFVAEDILNELFVLFLTSRKLRKREKEREDLNSQLQDSEDDETDRKVDTLLSFPHNNSLKLRKKQK